MLAEGMSRNARPARAGGEPPGAGGAIGYKHVASQKPDGYSLVWNSNSISTTFHSGQLKFDYKAFDAVARVLVGVGGARGAQRCPLEDAEGARRRGEGKPKAVTVGHSGIGSHTHISLAALVSATGVGERSAVRCGAGGAEPARRPRRRRGAAPAALPAPVKQGRSACWRADPEPRSRRGPTCRRRASSASTSRSTPGAASPCRAARRARSSRQLESRDPADGELAGIRPKSEKLGVRPAFLPAEEFSALVAKEDAELSRLMQQIGLKK